MPFWLVAAIVAVVFLGAMLLAPKPKIENAKANSMGDLQFPQTQDGIPNTIWWGRKRLRAPNVIWYGDFEARPIKEKVKTGLFSSKKVTVGHQYLVGFQLGLGVPTLSLASVHRIWWGDDKTAWQGSASGEPATITINLPNLLGGKKFGGGIAGTVRFYQGSFTQPIDGYLSSKVSDPTILPAYRGLTYLLFEHFMIGESTSVSKVSIEAETIPALLGFGALGEDGDANPIELIYDILNNDWGRLGLAITDIDEDSFLEAATTMVEENHGIAMELQNSNTASDVIEEVLKQIDGILYEEPTTREITIKLIRNDYDVNTLPLFDESNILQVQEYGCGLWEETFNEVRVVYEDRASEYAKKTAIAQDNSNISFQGKKRSTTFNYLGISNADLASRIASRELAVLSIPLAKMKIKTNRDGALLRPGSVIKVSWAEYNIAQMVMRVQKFDLGKLDDGQVTLELVEDQFGTEYELFGAPPTTVWPGQSQDPPVPVAASVVREAPYFFFQDYVIPAGRGGVIAAAEPGSTTTLSYALYSSTDGGANYNASAEELDFTEIASLTGPLSATAGVSTGSIGSITVANVATAPTSWTSAQAAKGYSLLLIDNELLAYESVTDLGSGAYQLNNVWRGVLDTVPQAHANNAPVYFIGADNMIEDDFPSTATVSFKFIPRTFRGVVDLADVTATTLTLARRAERPLPPANIKFDGGTAFAPPADGTGAKTVTWANRDRKSSTLRKLNDNINEYEEGQQTVFRYRKNGGAWTSTTLRPGANTYSFNAGATLGDTVDYEIYSTRDGLDSFSKWSFTAGASAGSGSNSSTGGSAPSDTTPTYDPPMATTSDTLITSEDIAANSLVNIYSDSGNFRVRKASASLRYPAHGYVKTATVSGLPAEVFFDGANDDMSGLAPGTKYLSTAGGITNTAPTTSGYIVQVVGLATAAGVFVFEPGDPVGLI